MDLKDYIRSIPDFPKEGILFYDISTLLAVRLRRVRPVRPVRPMPAVTLVQA